jgi:hypothetical protein
MRTAAALASRYQKGEAGVHRREGLCPHLRARGLRHRGPRDRPAPVDRRDGGSTTTALPPEMHRRPGGARSCHHPLARPDAAPLSLPVLVYAHGGDAGVPIDELGLLLLGERADDFLWVAPSFPSESLRVGARIFRSGGARPPRVPGSRRPAPPAPPSGRDLGGRGTSGAPAPLRRLLRLSRGGAQSPGHAGKHRTHRRLSRDLPGRGVAIGRGRGEPGRYESVRRPQGRGPRSGNPVPIGPPPREFSTAPPPATTAPASARGWTAGVPS